MNKFLTKKTKNQVATYTHFEEVLARIRPFGPYQIFCCVVILYASIEWCGNATFMDTLGSVEPDWNCTFSNGTSETIDNEAIDKCVKVKYCHDHGGKLSAVRDNLEFYSLRASFQLICDNDYVKDIQVIMSAGSLIGSIVGGHLGDTFGRQTIFFVGQLLILITSMFATAAQGWVSFAAIMGVNCLLYGMLETTTLTMMMEYTSNRYRLILNACFQWPIAYMVLSLIAFLTKDWQNYFVFMNLVASPLAIGFMLFHESPRWLLAKNKLNDACEVLNDIAHMRWNNTKARFTTRDLSSIGTPEGRTFYNLFHLFRTKRLAKQTIMQILSVFTYSLASSTYLFTTSGIHSNAIIYTLLDGVFRLFAPIIIVFLDYKFKFFGRKAQFLVALILEGLLFAAVIVLVATGHSYKDVVITVLIIVATMINDCVFWMNIVQITTQRYPTVIRCIAFGTIHCIKHLGAIVGVLLLQKLLVDNPVWAFAIPEAFILITLVAGFFFQPETKGKALMDSMVETKYGRMENALPMALMKLAAGHKVRQMELRQELKQEMVMDTAAAMSGAEINSPWVFKGQNDELSVPAMARGGSFFGAEKVKELKYEMPPPTPSRSSSFTTDESEAPAYHNHSYSEDDMTEHYQRQFAKELVEKYHSHDDERSRGNSRLVPIQEGEDSDKDDSMRL